MAWIQIVNIPNWTVQDVQEWMKGLDDDLQCYRGTFEDNQVNGTRLLSTSAEDLEDLNIQKIGHQELLLEAICLLHDLNYNLPTDTLQSVTLSLSCNAKHLHSVVSKRQQEREGSRVDEQFFRTDGLTSDVLTFVTHVITSAKLLISWLDRLPFCGNPEYIAVRNKVLEHVMKLNSFSQLTGDAAIVERAILTTSKELLSLSEVFIRNACDPLVIQPAYIELVTLRKSTSDVQLGLYIKTSTLDGIHYITETKRGSPAHINEKIHPGDEVLQINKQTVVGWSHNKLIGALKADKTGVVLTLKKRPCNLKTPGHVINSHRWAGKAHAPPGKPASKSYSRRKLLEQSKSRLEEHSEERPQDTGRPRKCIEKDDSPPGGLNRAESSELGTKEPSTGVDDTNGAYRPYVETDLDAKEEEQKINSLSSDMSTESDKVQLENVEIEVKQKEETNEDEKNLNNIKNATETSTDNIVEDTTQSDGVLKDEEIELNQNVNKENKEDEINEKDIESIEKEEKEVELNEENESKMVLDDIKEVVPAGEGDEEPVAPEPVVPSDLSDTTDTNSVCSERPSSINSEPSSIKSEPVGLTVSTRSQVKLRPKKGSTRSRKDRHVSCIDLGPGQYEGWLEKKADTRFGKWTPFWCVLKDLAFYYYKSKKDLKAKGIICLVGYEVKREEKKEEHKKQFQFRISHKGLKPFIFSAESKKDLDSWVEKLHLASVTFNIPEALPEEGNEELVQMVNDMAGYHSESGDESDSDTNPNITINGEGSVKSQRSSSSSTGDEIEPNSIKRASSMSTLAIEGSIQTQNGSVPNTELGNITKSNSYASLSVHSTQGRPKAKSASNIFNGTASPGVMRRLKNALKSRGDNEIKRSYTTAAESSKPKKHSLVDAKATSLIDVAMATDDVDTKQEPDAKDPLLMMMTEVRSSGAEVKGFDRARRMSGRKSLIRKQTVLHRDPTRNKLLLEKRTLQRTIKAKQSELGCIMDILSGPVTSETLQQWKNIYGNILDKEENNVSSEGEQEVEENGDEELENKRNGEEKEVTEISNRLTDEESSDKLEEAIAPSENNVVEEDRIGDTAVENNVVEEDRIGDTAVENNVEYRITDMHATSQESDEQEEEDTVVPCQNRVEHNKIEDTTVPTENSDRNSQEQSIVDSKDSETKDSLNENKSQEETDSATYNSHESNMNNETDIDDDARGRQQMQEDIQENSIICVKGSETHL
ncbi:CNK3/IPCEF1 fusion protein-like isoform X1 [Antedon mediterranea]|uniref:CNK3/IPCEF1 fusion protein-like isoform X1 n=1 Tax=Antedon mediterranea TaxID=105859 RepID=UPI003AF51D35